MVILVLIDLLFILNDIETCFVLTFLMIFINIHEYALDNLHNLPVDERGMSTL